MVVTLSESDKYLATVLSGHFSSSEFAFERV